MEEQNEVNVKLLQIVILGMFSWNSFGEWSYWHYCTFVNSENDTCKNKNSVFIDFCKSIGIVEKEFSPDVVISSDEQRSFYILSSKNHVFYTINCKTETVTKRLCVQYLMPLKGFSGYVITYTPTWRVWTSIFSFAGESLKDIRTEGSQVKTSGGFLLIQKDLQVVKNAGDLKVVGSALVQTKVEGDETKGADQHFLIEKIDVYDPSDLSSVRHITVQGHGDAIFGVSTFTREKGLFWDDRWLSEES